MATPSLFYSPRYCCYRKSDTPPVVRETVARNKEAIALHRQRQSRAGETAVPLDWMEPPTGNWASAQSCWQVHTIDVYYK